MVSAQGTAVPKTATGCGKEMACLEATWMLNAHFYCDCIAWLSKAKETRRALLYGLKGLGEERVYLASTAKV